MANIRRLFALILFIMCVVMIANAQSKSYKCVNNTESSTGRVKLNSSAPVSTDFELTYEHLI